MPKGKKSSPQKRTSLKRVRQRTEGFVRERLARLSKAQLVERIIEIARQNRDVWNELEEEFRVEKALESHEELIELARVAIDEATEVGLDWGGDYGKVGRLLKQLLKVGQADAVLELGRRLYERGERQVEMSDEGLMCRDIDECLSVVFQAVRKSSLSGVEQMVWAWDLAGEDGYCICTETNKKFWQRNFPRKDWSEFADRLQQRLADLDAMFNKPPKRRRQGSAYETNSTYRWRRDVLVEKIQEALLATGRDPSDVALERPS
jgi:uncharacterized Zn finger protein